MRLLPTLGVVLLTVLLPACGDDGTGPDGPAATVEMRSDNTFSPQTVTIDAGETVRWRNVSGFEHNTTSDTQIWSSDNLTANEVVDETFPTAGSFPYSCTLHQGMVGTVIVQ